MIRYRSRLLHTVAHTFAWLRLLLIPRLRFLDSGYTPTFTPAVTLFTVYTFTGYGLHAHTHAVWLPILHWFTAVLHTARSFARTHTHTTTPVRSHLYTRLGSLDSTWFAVTGYDDRATTPRTVAGSLCRYHRVGCLYRFYAVHWLWFWFYVHVACTARGCHTAHTRCRIRLHILHATFVPAAFQFWIGLVQLPAAVLRTRCGCHLRCVTRPLPRPVTMRATYLQDYHLRTHYRFCGSLLLHPYGCLPVRTILLHISGLPDCSTFVHAYGLHLVARATFAFTGCCLYTRGYVTGSFTPALHVYVLYRSFPVRWFTVTATAVLVYAYTVHTLLPRCLVRFTVVTRYRLHTLHGYRSLPRTVPHLRLVVWLRLPYAFTVGSVRLRCTVWFTFTFYYGAGLRSPPPTTVYAVRTAFTVSSHAVCTVTYMPSVHGYHHLRLVYLVVTRLRLRLRFTYVTVRCRATHHAHCAGYYALPPVYRFGSVVPPPHDFAVRLVLLPRLPFAVYVYAVYGSCVVTFAVLVHGYLPRALRCRSVTPYGSAFGFAFAVVWILLVAAGLVAYPSFRSTTFTRVLLHTFARLRTFWFTPFYILRLRYAVATRGFTFPFTTAVWLRIVYTRWVTVVAVVAPFRFVYYAPTFGCCYVVTAHGYLVCLVYTAHGSYVVAVGSRCGCLRVLYCTVGCGYRSRSGSVTYPVTRLRLRGYTLPVVTRCCYVACGYRLYLSAHTHFAFGLPLRYPVLPAARYAFAARVYWFARFNTLPRFATVATTHTRYLARHARLLLPHTCRTFFCRYTYAVYRSCLYRSARLPFCPVTQLLRLVRSRLAARGLLVRLLAVAPPVVATYGYLVYAVRSLRLFCGSCTV